MMLFSNFLVDGVLHLPEKLTLDELKTMDFSTALSLPEKVKVCGKAVKTCDSIGIAALVYLLKQAHAENVVLEWVNLPPTVLTLLNLYDLNNKDLIANAGKSD